MLCVRARNAAHLKALFPTKAVYQWPDRDYPARIFIAREDYAEFIGKRILEMTATNFKSSVTDDPLHDAYMGVWGVMNRYGQGFYDRRAKYSPLQSSFYDRFDDRPFNEQVLDDDDDDDFTPCTMPGCTKDNPCMNCIMDALAEGRGQNEDGSLSDRYGDFDEDEDIDATSHKRIAP